MEWLLEAWVWQQLTVNEIEILQAFDKVLKKDSEALELKS